jgi:hypothetical protein
MSAADRAVSSWRWPALVLVPFLLVAAAVAERQLDDEPDEAAPSGIADVALPTAAPPGSLSSTWYCAGGTAAGTEEGVAEHVVHIANASDADLSGQLTVYPSDGDPVAEPIEVAAHDRVAVRLSDLVTAPFASALVEVSGGEVGVEHELSGPTGRSIGACASSPSDSWYFPAGTTRAGTRLYLAVFNPFPGDAVVDISFDTDDGTRTPQSYQALVIPGGSVLPIDVSEVVTLRNDVATELTTRSGRVVVDQIQTVDDEETGTRGLNVTLGSSVSAETWLFPDGVGAEGYGERIVLYNPADAPAEVDVQVVLDDPDVNGIAEPFEVTVGPRSYSAVDVLADGRVPAGVGHAIVVRVRNDLPVVAQRVVTGTGDAVQPGLGYTMGSPLVATRWLVPVAFAEGLSGAALIVLNPSSTEPARFSVEAVADGATSTPDGFDGIELGPGERRIIDLGVEGLGLGQLALDLVGDGPVVAEIRLGFERGNDLNYLIAVPVAGTLREPVGTVGELSGDDIILDGG